MLMMVLGFVINALAASPVEQLDARIASLIPQNSPAIMMQGKTAGARYCELSVERSANGTSVNVFYGGMMGEGILSFSTSKNQVTNVSDQGFRMIVQSVGQSGQKQMLDLDFATSGQTQTLKSAEFFEESSSFFGGTKMKSEIRCTVN